MASSAAPRSKSRIRPRSRETKFSRLLALKCFPEVHARLVEGWTLTAVANFIQGDRKEYDDVSRQSLETILSEYRSSLPPAEVVQAQNPRIVAASASI